MKKQLHERTAKAASPLNLGKLALNVITGAIIRPKLIGQALGWALTAAFAALAGLVATLSPAISNALADALAALSQWLRDPKAFEGETVIAFTAILTPILMSLLSGLTSSRQAAEAAELQAILDPEELRPDGRIGLKTIASARKLRRKAFGTLGKKFNRISSHETSGGSGNMGVLLLASAAILFALPACSSKTDPVHDAATGAIVGAASGASRGGAVGAVMATAGKWFLDQVELEFAMRDQGIGASARLFGTGPFLGAWWVDGDHPSPFDPGYLPPDDLLDRNRFGDREPGSTIYSHPIGEGGSK